MYLKFAKYQIFKLKTHRSVTIQKWNFSNYNAISGIFNKMFVFLTIGGVS